MYILFDIGGSKMRFAKTTDLKEFSKPLIEETPYDYVDAMIVVNDLIEALSDGEEIQGIVGGIAGVFNREKGSLFKSPNLPDWEDKPLYADLQRFTGAQPEIFNDTDMGGMGEVVYGAGIDGKIVAYMTISTGIGGSLIIDKKVAPYHYGFEPGQQIVDYKNKKTLHNLAAGRDLEIEYGEASFTDDENFWNDVTASLAVGIYNMIHFWSPDTIVLGGGLLYRINQDKLMKILKSTVKMYPELPEFKESKLGVLNGLWGALAYLQNKN